ncbi:prolyl oligopeptidase family serine peptidase [Pseudoduganella eburnea]|uniref:Prolyl oligopeptidase family serine peptidase n=1 Tax=Massilia eburnea TaxID=1776165 RepID=A0A6L6QJ87_9BURK|nr:alpha/beta fold hydrolase [Massilia eburnea]MTW11693.1 prolyl oligopeptidase family serine peptidase [Massilia eburnea]
MKTLSLTLTIAMGLAAAPAAIAAVAPPPVEAFFENPAFSGALISPDGKYLAAKIGAKGKRNMLAVVDLATKKAQIVAHFSDTDIGNVQWVNAQRLLFDTADREAAQGDADYAPGLYAVDCDGGRFKQLASRMGEGLKKSSAQRDMLPWHTAMLPQTGPQDSDWVYVNDQAVDNRGIIEHVRLLRVNTVTGRTQSVERPGDVQFWLLDQEGRPRLASMIDKDEVSIKVRDNESAPWRNLATFKAFGLTHGVMRPVAFGGGDTLYVEAQHGADKRSIYRVDLASGKMDEQPLITLEGYDFTGRLVVRDGKLAGVHYLQDGEGTQWFDPALQALQADIDKTLPQTVNMLELPADAKASNVLVRAFSDVRPTSYYVYDRSAKTLSKVGDTYPAIDPELMGHQEQVRIKARDGMELPVMLTLPAQKAAQKLPMVVLVHGGPYLRGTRWAWNPEVQFLASRGYAVLQPEFRGSAGYGQRLLVAGWQQWGLTMQDDIADATKWAIAKGYADPKRICIAGASYGGYATLMGLVNNPELYRCGVEWAGVTDINLLFSGHWMYRDDSSVTYRRYGMPVMIGDPEKDAARFKATSPVEQADRIRQPLLMAHGGADMRVPLVHGLKMRDAVQRNNKQVEWIEYAQEGHGWYLPSSRIDFWNRVETFLQRNIGKE